MSEPIAWLIRITRGEKARVMPGYMSKSEGPARLMAYRHSNRWQKCEAFPVVEMES